MNPDTKKRIFYVVVFATAMAFLETSVVVYLRELFYEGGFSFPLRPMPSSLARVEILREAATIIMLICAGYLAGKNKLQRFAYFNIAFAVWDLFYYVFLFVLVDWPKTLSEWDLLFLIPFPWVGPVWAPCLLCLLMIVGSVHVVQRVEHDSSYSIEQKHWIMLITGAAVCILAFMWDYFMYTNQLWTFGSSSSLFEEMQGYVPRSFNHWLFFAGFLMMAFPVAINIRHHRKQSMLM